MHSHKKYTGTDENMKDNTQYRIPPSQRKLLHPNVTMKILRTALILLEALSLSVCYLIQAFETSRRSSRDNIWRHSIQPPFITMQATSGEEHSQHSSSRERAVTGSVYMATTVDGKIADVSGSVAFLDEYQSTTAGSDMGFGDFLASVDVVIMGRKSFEKVLSFGPDMWAYGITPVVVWSRKGVDVPDYLKETVSCSSLSPMELFHQFEKEGRRHAYIDGGFTVQCFLKEGLVDNLVLTQVPMLLGEGISLFNDSLGRQVKLAHLNTKVYPNGLVQNSYRVVNV